MVILLKGFDLIIDRYEFSCFIAMEDHYPVVLSCFQKELNAYTYFKDLFCTFFHKKHASPLQLHTTSAICILLRLFFVKIAPGHFT